MALAVLADAALNFFLPPVFRVGELGQFLYPGLLLVLLAILIIWDPGRIDRQSPTLRIVLAILISVISIASVLAAIRVVVAILADTNSIQSFDLLRVSVVTWLTTTVAFAFWYWFLDCGGAAARARGGNPGARAFRFFEYELAEPEYEQWFPHFVDYLALSFATATSFGPSDAPTTKSWAKLMVLGQGLVSMALLALAFTQALNTL